MFLSLLPGLRLVAAVHPVAAVGMYRGWTEAQAAAHAGGARQRPRGHPRVVPRAPRARGTEVRGVGRLETRPEMASVECIVNEKNVS